MSRCGRATKRPKATTHASKADSPSTREHLILLVVCLSRNTSARLRAVSNVRSLPSPRRTRPGALTIRPRPSKGRPGQTGIDTLRRQRRTAKRKASASSSGKTTANFTLWASSKLLHLDPRQKIELAPIRSALRYAAAHTWKPASISPSARQDGKHRSPSKVSTA